MSKLKDLTKSICLYAYRHAYIPLKANQIRKKDVIKVAFPLHNLSKWKTEMLYVEMCRNSRFKPIIIAFFYGAPNAIDDREKIAAYCKSKGYDCIVTDRDITYISKNWTPDIIFYPDPYTAFHEFRHNLKSLSCYIVYGIRQTLEKWEWKLELLYNCWQIYYENILTYKQYKGISNHDIDNHYLTGLPIMDELTGCNDDTEQNNPWINSNDRKRIIYAPHHSITPDEPLHIGTFLENCDLMLELAEKYSDKVQWAFKPHPVLYSKLCSLWGKKKTDSYYNQWNNLQWSQVETGKYSQLFKYSDAMIHDCASFAVEYLFVNKPVMYLTKGKHLEPKLNDFFIKALDIHELGYTPEEIETFIRNVIIGNDVKMEQRNEFISDYLNPPFNKKACENIINCILYSDKAKEMQP